MVWVFVVISATLLLLAVLLLRSRDRSSKLRHAQACLQKWSASQPSDSDQRNLLKSLFFLIAEQPEAGDEAIAYKAASLLQLAYGQGLARPDEPVCLTSLVGTLLQQDRPALAAAVLDTYRGMLRTADVVVVSEQLQTAGVMALKAKHSFVAAKSVDIIFAFFERPERVADASAVSAALGAINVIGQFSVKRADQELFRELTGRVSDFLDTVPPPAASAAVLVSVFSQWMHVIVSKQDETSLKLLADMIQSLAVKNLLNVEIIAKLLPEWQDLVGIASLNPYNRIAVLLVHDMAVLAVKTKDPAVWTDMVRSVMKTVRLIVEQYGIRYAFLLLYPLFEESRKLLIAQTRFTFETSDAKFRQHALHLMLRETLQVAEFAARLRITGTTYDIIEELYTCWRDDPTLNYKLKSAKKLFQLMLLFWQKNMARQAQRQMPGTSELLEPTLLTQVELERFTFMVQ